MTPVIRAEAMPPVIPANAMPPVIPAEAGIQGFRGRAAARLSVDPRLRGDDERAVRGDDEGAVRGDDGTGSVQPAYCA
jgi:hypothetical protein